MVVHPEGLAAFPCCDSSNSPSSTDCLYVFVCVLFRLPRPSSVASLGGAVDAGGAEGSSGKSLNVEGQRWGASGDLIANVIDVLP